MSDLADLYPGFASEWINTKAGRIFARVGGKGPPLLLLHGFSETHVMWHRVAPQLSDRFTLIIADLPGYGWSDMPDSDKDHTPYTKRAMAQTMIDAMEQLGHVHFALAGHDRGGRVAYRLALDHPGRLSRLAVLDILPTYDYWERMNRLYALKIYHWTFLAQPAPLPETLISGNPDFFLKQKMASQTKSKNLDAIDRRALEHYLAPFRDPSRVHAMCEDYRAGAYADYRDRQERITTQERKSRSRCWRCGATPELPAPRRRRSTPGRIGRPMSRARLLIPVIFSPRKIRTRRRRRCGRFFWRGEWGDRAFRHCRHCEERSDEAIQPASRLDGLLRGACHRARIRATRWLAMTGQQGRYLLTRKNSFSSAAASVSPTPEYTSGT